MNRRYQHLLIFTLSLLITACGGDYRDHQGNTGSFSSHRGHWLVINYWAAWCKPCIEEIPELNRLATEQSDRVTVFGVDYDNNTDAALLQAIEKLDIRFPVLTADPAIKLGFERPAVLPTTVLISPDGKPYKSLVGPQTEAKILKAIGLTASSP